VKNTPSLQKSRGEACQAMLNLDLDEQSLTGGENLLDQAWHKQVGNKIEIRLFGWKMEELIMAGESGVYIAPGREQLHHHCSSPRKYVIYDTFFRGEEQCDKQ
jgi:hypothetical protein